MDDYQYLDEVEGAEALAWAEGRSAETLARFEADPSYEGRRDAALEILEATDKIPFASIEGEVVYNFWQDADHVRGIWRRLPYERYVAGGDRPGDDEWEVVLDLDQLADDEDENWVWKGANISPDRDRAMVVLSPGGTDASVQREFDLEAKRFVEGGFVVPLAKSGVAWVDADNLLVATDFGPDTLTDSGYPATVRRWARGTALADTTELHRVEPSYVGLWPGSSHRDDGIHVFAVGAPDFFSEELWLIGDEAGGGDGDELTKLPLPSHADVRAFFGGQVLAVIREAWQGHRAGSLIALDLASGDVESVLIPDERTSINAVAATADMVVITVLRNVVSSTLLARPGADGWSLTPVELGSTGSVELLSVPGRGRAFHVAYNDHLTPPTVLEVVPDGEPGDATITVTITEIMSQPARFDATGLVTEQYWAASADGTEIPYFQIGPAEAAGPQRVVLYGYGGFEIALTPGYNATVGKLWLEQGNTYVVANIRGGGEFGPAWHQAALKTNRVKAWEDFEAVAADLIDRGVTTPSRLAISGGSNGGLLVSAAFTRHPERYRGVFCAVPLIDMLTFHKLLAGASWIGEYGDPDVPDVQEFWAEHSPYHRVRPDVEYPKVFFYTSTRDDRVHPGHARRMVARMTDLGHDVFYYENTEGGHAAGANLKQQARLAALQNTYYDQILDPAES